MKKRSWGIVLGLVMVLLFVIPAAATESTPEPLSEGQPAVEEETVLTNVEEQPADTEQTGEPKSDEVTDDTAGEAEGSGSETEESGSETGDIVTLDAKDETSDGASKEESIDTKTTEAEAAETAATLPTVEKRTVNGVEGWWYVNAKGKVDTSYTGFATNSSGTWYVKSGKVSKKVNGVYKDTTGAIGSKNSWYYVLNSKVQYDFTGLADYKNASGWWYITKGKVDRSVTTVAKNKNGWWYVENGKVDKSYTGFATNENGSWYMEKGKLKRDQNTVIKDTKGALGSTSKWYYVVGSKVQTSFTGLADYSNASGWWYIKNGKVDRSYNGLAKNKNGWWYVTNGKVDRTFTGTAQNSNGWWYVENGKVDKSAVALVKTDGVWQAYKSGKFASTYTGIAQNENGLWYVADGVLDRTYSGTYTSDDGTWNIKDGKVISTGKGGWVKVGSDYYCYDRNTGKLYTNTTVDGIKVDSTGKAKASSDDVYKIKTMIKARELMESITKTSDTQSEKLRKCFDWAVDMSYSRIRYASQTKRDYPNTWTAVYANDGIGSQKGTCFTSACVFAYLAKECGYTSIDICDDTGHAWVEINGLVYDPDSARSNFSRYYGTTPETSGRTNAYSRVSI